MSDRYPSCIGEHLFLILWHLKYAMQESRYNTIITLNSSNRLIYAYSFLIN